MDRGRRGPGTDAPRRLPAPGRVELARPPQRHYGADGVDRRPRHPVPVRHRGAVLRVRPRRDRRRRADHAGALALRAAVGPSRTASALCGRAGCRIAAAGLPVGAHRPSSRRPARDGARGVRRHGRAGSRGGPLHRPRHRRRRAAHHPRRVPPPRPRRRDGTGPGDRFVGLPGLRRVRQRSPSATSRGRSPAATCSSFRRGSRSRRGPRPAGPTPTPGRSTCSGSATPRSSRRSACTAPRPRPPDEARHDPRQRRDPRRAARR